MAERVANIPSQHCIRHMEQKEEAPASVRSARREGTSVSQSSSTQGRFPVSPPVTTLPFDEPLLLGEVLGPYRIESLIGYGGMSIVYRAVQVSLQRPVALKLLPLSFAHNPTLVESFVLEARAAAALQHPNIIPIYDCGEINGHYFIAMRYVDGLPLARAIPDKGFLINRAVTILVQVANALDYAHSHGVVHRDISASNVMLEVEDHVTLMDFGIAQARATSRLTRAGIAVGTLEYLAPERARGEASTPQTDIYSLGVLAFELLTGHLPYQAADDRALLQQHLAAPIPPLRRQRPDIPPSVEAAVQRCLAKHPQERFFTASEFVHALTDSTSNARRSTAPLPRVESVSPPVTRPLNTSPSPIPAVPSPTHPRLPKRHHTWKFPWWTLGVIAALTIITLGTQIAPSLAHNLQLPRLAINTTSHATNPSSVPTATPHPLVLPTPTPHPQPTPTPTPIPIPVIHPTTYGAAIQGFYNALLTAISTRNQADWMRAYAYLSPTAQKHQSLTAFEQQYAADHSIAWRWNPGTIDSPTEVSVPTHLTEYRTGGNLSSNFDWVIINNQQGWHLDHTIPLADSPLPTHPLPPGSTTHGQERN